jgi:hypothetical protein
VALDIFPDIARKKSRFQMVSDGSIVFVDFVRPEICVISEDCLGSIRSSLGG